VNIEHDGENFIATEQGPKRPIVCEAPTMAEVMAAVYVGVKEQRKPSTYRRVVMNQEDHSYRSRGPWRESHGDEYDA